MKIKDGTELAVALVRAHGSRTFKGEVHRDWAVLKLVELHGEFLFEVELPIAELGKLIAGQMAVGVVGWSLDDRRRKR